MCLEPERQTYHCMFCPRTTEGTNIESPPGWVDVSEDPWIEEKFWLCPECYEVCQSSIGEYIKRLDKKDVG